MKDLDFLDALRVVSRRRMNPVEDNQVPESTRRRADMIQEALAPLFLDDISDMQQEPVRDSWLER